MNIQQYESLDIPTRIFLLSWRENPVSAIGKLNLLENQTDHCPGSGLYKLVYEDNVIDRAEFHEAIETWLSVQFQNPLYSQRNNSRFLYAVLMEIYNYASWNAKRNELCNRITENFGKHVEFIDARFKDFDFDEQKAIRKMLIHCISRSEEKHHELFHAYFYQLLWGNPLLSSHVYRLDGVFAAVYYHPDEERWDINDAYRYLRHFTEKVREAAKCDPNEKSRTVKESIDALKTLLYEFFLSDKGASGAREEVDARVEDWLEKNNIA